MYPPPATPAGHPAAIAAHDTGRAHAAAREARARFPGAAGEILAREVEAWASFGYQGGRSLVTDLVDDLLVLRQPVVAGASCEASGQ